MTPSDQNALVPARDLLAALTGTMREAKAAIASRDLPRLEGAVRRQQELAALLSAQPACIREFAQKDSRLLLDLAEQSSVLSCVMRRSSDTIRALSSVVNGREPLYSLESLPRR